MSEGGNVLTRVERAFDQVATYADQCPEQRQIIDLLREVPGADHSRARSGQLRQIGRAANFFYRFVAIKQRTGSPGNGRSAAPDCGPWRADARTSCAAAASPPTAPHPHTLQSRVAEPPKACLDHADRTLCLVTAGINSELGRLGKSFRTCATAVARSRERSRAARRVRVPNRNNDSSQRYFVSTAAAECAGTPLPMPSSSHRPQRTRRQTEHRQQHCAHRRRAKLRPHPETDEDRGHFRSLVRMRPRRNSRFPARR